MPDRIPPTRPSPSPRGNVTDSPLFWLPIYLVGALAALILTLPKYSWRQPQIERQFQARERAGQAVSIRNEFSPLSTVDRPMLTLRPLMLFFGGVLLLATILFWGWRLRGTMSRKTRGDPS